MSTWMMTNFQDSNFNFMTYMTYFHDLILLILIMILIFIMYLIFWFSINKFINLNILYNHFLEIIWTFIPMIILIFLALPSLTLLYFMEDLYNYSLNIKIMGHQWFWSYEYINLNLEFDSYMINKNSSNFNFRLLDVDNRLILPFNLMIRSMVSSTDVIHSWTIPSMGIKIDACPGRLNQFFLNINRPGLFYGQCSEICGLNHSFMPIVLESISMKNFLNWLKNI